MYCSVIMNDELGETCEEVVAAYFKVQSDSL
jgi:hypothetical protein